MNKIKSAITLCALAGIVAGTAGCYTEHRTHGRRVYEPAGAQREYYYRDGRYYAPRDERNRQWYHNHDDRYDGGHQWDNRNYQRD